MPYVRYKRETGEKKVKTEGGTEKSRAATEDGRRERKLRETD